MVEEGWVGQHSLCIGLNDSVSTMFDFADFILVNLKPSLYDDCRGFAGVGMSHFRVCGRRRHGVLGPLRLGWLARCVFCEAPDSEEYARA